jgi:hypothetical protein
MLLIFDLDRKKCVEAVGSARPVSQVEGKRGYDEEVAVQLVRGGEVVELGASEELGYAIKEKGKYDTDPALVEGSGADFVWDATSQLYRASANYVSTALDTLFAVNASDTDDVGSLALAIEIGWRATSVANWRRSENDITLTLRNNYLREEDGTAAGLPDPYEWLFRYGMLNPGYWTALTGAADETVLDARVTAGGAVPTGHVVMTAIGGVLRRWQLQVDPDPGVTVENAAGGIVFPDDYHVTTNPRIWVEIV